MKKNKYIKELVKKIMNKYGTSNPYEICDILSITVVFTKLTSDIKGFYNYNKNYNVKFIFINEELDDIKKRFTCAHELAHSILHNNINTVYLMSNTFLKTNMYEIEANIFACELLYSDDEFLDNLHLTVTQLSNMFGISEFLIEYRLEQFLVNV